MVAEKRVKQVPYTVTRTVQEQRTVDRVRYVWKQVPYTVTCWVPKPACCPTSCDPCEEDASTCEQEGVPAEAGPPEPEE